MAKRDYQRELLTEKRNHPERVKERAGRNAARAILVDKLGAAAMKGKEAEHKDGRATNNKPSNLKPVSPKDNNNGRRGGPARRK
jgi:hypothetical protein